MKTQRQWTIAGYRNNWAVGNTQYISNYFDMSRPWEERDGVIWIKNYNLMSTTDRTKLVTEVERVRTELYKQIFALNCLRAEVDPNEHSTIDRLTVAINAIRHVANYNLHDLK
jgi:hypothetical protein